MKTALKLFFLFSMLLMASAASFASEKQHNSPPGCMVTMEYQNDITIPQTAFCTVNQVYTYDYISMENRFITHTGEIKTIIGNRELMNSTRLEIYATDKIISNLVPLPHVRYLNANNSTNHYSNILKNSRLSTARHV